MIWVKDIMTPISGSLTEVDTCQEAVERVANGNAAGWPVVDGEGEFVGIATLRSLGRLLKEKGWITSDATIYGGSGKPSILARAAGSGYATQEGKLAKKGIESA